MENKRRALREVVKKIVHIEVYSFILALIIPREDGRGQGIIQFVQALISVKKFLLPTIVQIDC